MSDEEDRLFVITGGPGSGKSTLIAGLRDAGACVSEESGRRIIRDQTAIGGRALPSVDPLLFAEMMLAQDLQAHRIAQGSGRVVYFDRGVPDVLGYLRLTGIAVPAHMQRAASLFRYSRTIFIAPPWPEIYRHDEERKQSLQEAERTCEAMAEIYTACGYRLVELPRAPVKERVDFVLEASK